MAHGVHVQYFTLPPLVRSDSIRLHWSPMESDQVLSDSNGVRQSPIGLQWSPTDSEENNDINVLLLHHINNYLFRF